MLELSAENTHTIYFYGSCREFPSLLFPGITNLDVWTFTIQVGSFEQVNNAPESFAIFKAIFGGGAKSYIY